MDILVRHINEQIDDNIVFGNFKPFIMETSTEKYHSKHIILVKFFSDLTRPQVENGGLVREILLSMELVLGLLYLELNLHPRVL